MTQESPRPHSERAHYVRSPASWIGGCSDAGQRHGINQDALCLAVREEPRREAVLAVADGVTTALSSEVASLVAAETAVNELTMQLEAGNSPEESFARAFAHTNDEVLAATQHPSACTLITALIQPGHIVVGNVGDSRAYWLGDDRSCVLLSTDDSMAQARMMLGMTRHEAEQSSQAHAITKWLGRQASDVTPSMITFEPPSDGWLLLCSDGLWNYASDPETMTGVFQHHLRHHQEPAALAEALVGWANSRGGKDNITVVVARVTA